MRITGTEITEFAGVRTSTKVTLLSLRGRLPLLVNQAHVFLSGWRGIFWFIYGIWQIHRRENWSWDVRWYQTGVTVMVIDPERERVREMRDDLSGWRRWGPYISDRSWGTVREDYS